MICADFLAETNLDNGDPEYCCTQFDNFFKFLPGEQKQEFPTSESEGFMNRIRPKGPILHS
ncbi:MAG: hypothetical protein DMG69_32375 [Acidobacteria bacterium]|nr:MAG: hypothetical protein DMG69_32375 [Acidobacteriota bacterium]